jgi:transposase
VFNAWLEHQLLPSLTTPTVVVMDNARFHKTLLTQRLIAAAGHILLYLAPYSPDLNPIEPDWAVIKHHHRYDDIPLDTILASYRTKVT